MIEEQALNNLRPSSEWILRGNSYNDLEWIDTNVSKPTEKEFTDEVIRLKNTFNSLEYKRNREKEYLPLSEQLDMIYWDKVNGTNNWEEHVSKVKDIFPKPEMQ